MPNTCGYAVAATSTTSKQIFGLYTVVALQPVEPEYKSSTFPLLRAQVIQQLIHYFSGHLTTVGSPLIPTIHTTNKNNKKFFIHKFNTYYRKAV
jgi:hypothetical protein